jgi:hypothetical protein
MPVAGHLVEDRVAAHYRWAGRYTDRGEPHKAVAHFGRALALEAVEAVEAAEAAEAGGAASAGATGATAPPRFGGLGGLFGRKEAAAPLAALPYDRSEDRLKLYDTDAQSLFYYVKDACSKLAGVETTETGSATVNGMDIGLMKKEMEVWIEVKGSRESAKWEISALGTGHSLYAIGRALDECAMKLQGSGVIDGDKRLFLQRDIMALAHMSYLDYVERKGEWYVKRLP